MSSSSSSDARSDGSRPLKSSSRFRASSSAVNSPSSSSSSSSSSSLRSQSGIPFGLTSTLLYREKVMTARNMSTKVLLCLMVAVEPGKWPLKTPSSILWQWLCDTNLRGGSLMSDLVASSATEECHSASSFEVTSKTSSSLAASDLSSFSMALSIPMAHVSYSSRCSTHSPGKSRSCMRCAQRDASTAQRRGSCVFFHRERARSGCPDTTAQSIRSHQTGRMYETRSRDRTSEM
mmetsp:Transcript_1874/g.6150  ORF Transcript_1874/g.6150 Transcript_1874/m.6150 type:complete len:234 (+) Transcript_1874:1141-1842(+)